MCYILRIKKKSLAKFEKRIAQKFNARGHSRKNVDESMAHDLEPNWQESWFVGLLACKVM